MAEPVGLGEGDPARFSILLEASPIGMALVSPDGVFLTVNPALCQMLDLDEAALMSATWQQLTHPDDLRLDLQFLQELIAGDRDSFRTRKRYLRRDGTIVWCDLSVSCVRTDEGTPRYFVSQMIDVTEGVRAQERLAESESRYRMLAENGTDVVSYGTDDGTGAWVSDSVTALLGWTPDEMVGKKFIEFVHPEDRVVLAAVQQAARRGEPGGCEVRMRTSVGGYRWVSLLLKPVFDERGKVIGRVAGWRDYEDAHRAQESLAASEARYRLLLENASDVVFHSVAGVIDWMAPTVTRVLGWRPDEMVGLTTAHLWHPDDRAAAVALRDGVVTSKTESRVVRVMRKDGTYAWVEVSLQPLLGADGRPGAVGMMRDVSDRVAVERSLAASERRYRLLAENASDVVYLRDAEGRIQWVSPSVSTLLGWDPEELVGVAATDFVHPDDVSAVLDRRDRATSGGPLEGAIMRIRTADGKYRHMSVGSRDTHNASGEVAGAVVGLRDVDDLVRARDAAEVARAQAEDERRRLHSFMDAQLDPTVGLQAVRDETGELVDLRFTFVNDAAATFHGTPREELVGSLLLSLSSWRQEPGPLDQFFHTVETGEPTVIDGYVHAPATGWDARHFDVRGVKHGDGLTLTWRDVTERQQAVRRIADSEMKYRLLAENSSDVVMRTRDNTVIWVSPSLTRVLGWAPDDWIGHSMSEFGHPNDISVVEAGRVRMGEGTPALMRLRLMSAEGDYHWVEVHAQQYVDTAGIVDGFLSSFRIIDREIEAEEQLERRARFDDLTGALKREEALSVLPAIVGRPREDGSESSVLFIDIDAFKAVNDTWGHPAGDALLRTFSQRIHEVVGRGDVVARMGGDEFLVILDGVRDLAEAEQVANEIRAAVSAPVPTREGSVVATVSIGLTTAGPGESADAIVSRADAAMYRAKQDGRNRVIAVPAAQAGDGPQR